MGIDPEIWTTEIPLLFSIMALEAGCLCLILARLTSIRVLISIPIILDLVC